MPDHSCAQLHRPYQPQITHVFETRACGHENDPKNAEKDRLSSEKEAVPAMPGPHDFFGEGSLVKQSLRISTEKRWNIQLYSVSRSER
jgi:hypothetical protein